MKTLAALSAAVLIPTGALVFASSSGHAAQSHRPLGFHALLARSSSPLSAMGFQRHFHTLVNGTATPGTPVPATAVPATPSPTGTPAATPGPTGTVTNYPDPVSLLQKTALVYQHVTSAHYELVTDGEQQGIEKVHLDAAGDVTCSGPSLKGNVVASDTIEGTSQIKKLNLHYVVIKKKAYVKGKSTKNKWAAAKPATLSQLGIAAGNFLICPSTSSGTGSGSGSNDQVKNVINLGPDTFQGVPVWHIQAIDITADAQGKTTQGTLDYLISQDHFLPYVFSYTSNADPNSTFTQKQILTKFGESVKVKAPKIGSKKP